MNGIARLGDQVGLDGVLIVPPNINNVFVNNKPVAVVSQLVSPHEPCETDPNHCATTIIQGSKNVFVQNKSVARVHDSAACGDVIIAGSTNVFS
jgi:uncharacterized Zn-binding protein involved in type VI secretion